MTFIHLMNSYLCEEWKERHKDTSEDVSSKFLNLRFIPLEVLKLILHFWGSLKWGYKKEFPLKLRIAS